MMRKIFHGLFLLGLCSSPALADVTKVWFAHQNGWAYTPLYVMRELKLVEKHAKDQGITLEADLKNLGNAGTIRDAILAGDVQFGVVGPPTLITMYDKTKDIKLVANFVSLPMLLNTKNLEVKTVCDFAKFSGKIGLPTVKSSVQAVTLQIAVKKQCGKYDMLDRLTVGLTHPDAMTALMSDAGDISAHFASPPFQNREIETGKGKIKTVLNSYDVLGGKTSFIMMIGSEKWAKANPKAFAAVSAAIQEAIQITANDKAKAAEIYLKWEKSKETAREIVKQMSSPDISFDATPKHIETYSNFMSEIGTIKSKPTWKDMSMETLHSKSGS